ncbi:T9SS type A sorting domain-containing protein [Polaribacter septentrionalilitoris]|uniref:T9SS type A sorting domain-containing protein n=1 Tax=Polaribacter septentrionalilitoris TaxID=2494657 RepID=UPI00135B4ABA|nr:T9SS type A sorting domain-containing protein [Polaribacter septentrionalilitoris]
MNWPQWSRENKVDIINSSNTTVLSFDNDYGTSGNTSFLNQNSNTVNLPNGDYTVRVYDGYGDSWNGSTSYARIFVNGSQVFDFDGNFNSNPNNGTEVKQDFSLTIGSIDDASFSYAQSGYCQTLSDPIPTITGETGGTFASTSGLVINSSTGQIDLSASTLGSYVVTYTTTAPDQNSSTQNITISDGDVATFAYASSFATQNENDISPTTTGQSGTYSSTSGLSINSSNGTIDVSASTPGLYTVSYTTNGSCPKIYTDSVQIISSTYYSNSKKYIEYIPGTMPVIISAPHGGTLTGSELATRRCGTGEMDDNTDILIREIQKKCFEQFGVYPYIIINNLRRNKLDPNRTESVATCGNSAAKPYFDAYHSFIDQASADVTTKFGKGLYIDLHGQSHSIPRIEAGYNLPSSSFEENLNNTTTNVTELARVTIKNLIDNNIQNLTFEDLIRGSQSFGGLMQTTGGAEYAALGHAGCSRGVGYRTVPSHVKTGSDQGSCDDTNPGGNSYFAGDYYSNIRHGSGTTSYANSVVGGGGSVNGGGGTIDGIMTEVNRRVRDLGSSYSSIYGRSDSRSATIPYFSRDYARVIEDFIQKHYNDFSNFSYNTAIHSIYGLDPSPTITGVSGGTFSSSSGLSINSSTGVIDVSASSPGSYTVSYTAPNVGEFYSKEFSITINSDPVTNTFTASSGNWSDLSNWSLTRIPLITDNVSIPSGNTVNLDLSNVSVNDISVVGTLTINSGKSLTVTGNLNNTGTTIINSDVTASGSLIVQGNATGNIIYNRYIKDNSNWYMISSPVENLDIDTFVTSNPILTGSGSNVGLSNYNNTTSTWEYYQKETTDSGDFILGDGRAVKRTTPGSLVFTGNLKTDDVLKPVKLGSDGWNLIGNPYPSLLNVNTNANSSNNMVSVNFANLSAGFKALYFWDAVNGSYIPFNNASDAKYIAPGQGFFVKIDGNTSISFNENMQTHQLGDNFLKSQNTFNIKLKVNNGTSGKETDIKYINKMTLGIDEGYDARLFDDKTPFSISTFILDESDNHKYAIQVLPTYNYDSMVIPVSINTKSNTELVFTVEANNIPDGFNIYLEDRELNIFTKFNKSELSYKVNISNEMNGDKRFYLHTTSGVLSAENVTYDSSIRIYQNTQNTLKIEGLKKEDAKIKLISILGKEVFKEALKNTLNQEVKVNNISKGIYIVQISFASGKITKKIIFD